MAWRRNAGRTRLKRAAVSGEFDLIERIRARAGTRDDVLLGIGDDAALLMPPPGVQLALATDTLNIGVHFPVETSPADIGWKSLAVNLSDLAAMGAVPAWASLSLSMPVADSAWVDAFLDGFTALASLHDVALIGGDTTRGPLSVCVSVVGFVEPGAALRRDGAQVGDEIWVSGTLGDAAAALSLLQWGAGEAAPHEPLRVRLDRPTPRVALGHALRGIAHACIDVSDGLLADLGHLCAASGVGAAVNVDALPASDVFAKHGDADLRRRWQATGGDDYELCFTAPVSVRESVTEAAERVGVAVTCIGRMVEGSGADPQVEGKPWQAARVGYRHFEE